jgi:hypothetical protein
VRSEAQFSEVAPRIRQIDALAVAWMFTTVRSAPGKTAAATKSAVAVAVLTFGDLDALPKNPSRPLPQPLRDRRPSAAPAKNTSLPRDHRDKRYSMSTNRNNTLKLRKHSIRTLTPSELRVAHGGGYTGGRGAGRTAQTSGRGGGATK